MDLIIKGLPDKRLSLLDSTSFLSFLKGEDISAIKQCTNYPVDELISANSESFMDSKGKLSNTYSLF